MIIADTGFWLALADTNDRYHQNAVEALGVLSEGLISTWPVITETCHMLATRLGAVPLHTFIRSARDGAFEIFDVQVAHLSRIERLMVKYQELPMDLADASLVILAEELGSGRILSTDQRDFRTYRWKSRKPFTNLLSLN
jgi:uncharacterized protein